MRRVLFATLIFAGAVFAQTAAGPDTFEVASVKPAAPQEVHRVMIGMRGGPGTPDPERLQYTNVSLKQILTNAYNVKAYQIAGPAYLDTERFDVTAKIPKGATKEQFQTMLQNFLADRFKLTLHREKKDFPMYGLVVGKNGHKLKESEPAPPVDANAPPAPLPPPDRLPVGKDGFPQLPRPAGGRGGMMVMFNGGRLRLQASGQTMTGLADMLSNQLGRPVVDETGVPGKFDFTLDFAPEEGMGLRGPMGGLPMPPPPPAGGGDGAIAGPGPGAGPSASDGGPNLITAVQEQLGLKLESKKGPLDLLVIDHIEKVPTEN